MSNLERTEQIYRDYADTFNELESELKRSFGIPAQVTADSVKRIVLSQLNQEIAPTFLMQRGALRSFGLYFGVMLYFAIFSIVGDRRRELSADVLFEEWGWRCYRDFYAVIHQELSRFDVKMLSTAQSGVFAKDLVNPVTVIDRGRQKRFGKAIARKIFWSQARNFSFFLRLSKSTGLNFVDLGLRLLRQIATYETDTMNLRARFLISASDNHYSALRFFIYKRNGIENILLIQNGARVALHAGYSSFIYCDYYIGWSARRIARFYGMQCPNKLAFGSINQYRAIARIQPDVEPRFDIVFIEQIYGRPVLLEPGHMNYLKAVENLKQFARLHPELRILYKGRPNREITCERNKVRDIDQLLENSLVQLDFRSAYSSYQAIAESRLMIACDSSMRVEALSMGKNVLTLNYSRTTTDFLVQRPDELGVLIESDFAAFSERILFLLDNESDSNVVEYFKEKRVGLQETSGDPSVRLAELVVSKLA